METPKRPVYTPKQCTPRDLFRITREEGEHQELIDTIIEYLKPFAAPHVINGKTHCFNCGGEWDSFKQALGLGVAGKWGMAHGEGTCSGCGWPCRGMHYCVDKDGKELFTLRNFFLLYMPENVETVKPDQKG